jgi:hypothetical protein
MVRETANGRRSAAADETAIGKRQTADGTPRRMKRQSAIANRESFAID